MIKVKDQNKSEPLFTKNYHTQLADRADIIMSLARGLLCTCPYAYGNEVYKQTFCHFFL